MSREECHRDRARLLATAPALDLPPLFRLVTLREVGDAFAHATEIAADEGAGTLVWVGRFDLVEFALVLEPDEPLLQARRAHLRRHDGARRCARGACAAREADRVRLARRDPRRRRPGRRRAAGLADRRDEEEPPPWLVFGATVRTVAMGEGEPGLRPLAAALEDEGFDGLGSGRLVESFARHFMVAVDAWQQEGFRAVARDYIARLSAPSAGVRRQIDENGDLLARRVGEAEPERRLLLRRWRAASWLDPDTGGPRA